MSVVQAKRDRASGVGGPARRRTIFSTGQIAKLCKVAPRTVTKWFDSGRLKGYRIPGSLDRRVPRENLIQFLKDHNMPLGPLAAEEGYRVLLVGTDPRFGDELAGRLGDGFTLGFAADPFAAGLTAGTFQPDAVLLDAAVGRAASAAIAARLPAVEGRPPYTMALLDEHDDDAAVTAAKAVYGRVYRRPFDAQAVADRLAELRADKLGDEG